MAKFEVLVLAVSFFCHLLEAQHIVIVSPKCSQTNGSLSSGSGELNCLDSTLNNLRNGTSLLLEPGTHIVRQAQSLDSVGLSDISITGAGVNETVVTCEDGHGLVFIGVKNLSLAGFTILNCGLANEQLDNAFFLLHLSINFFFLTIPPTSHTKVAMLIGNCVNVMMEDVHITNTTGLGLLGINVVGSSVVNRVNFTWNIRPLCLSDTETDFQNLLYFNQIGGGAYFLYLDYIEETSTTHSVELQVTNSYFAYNADCTSSAVTSVNFGSARTSSSQFSYTLGAGGGLSIIVASSNIEVSVAVMDSTFYRNDARYGAGAFVATFDGSRGTTSVVFQNCAFLENGAVSRNGIQNTYCQGGGGLAVFMGLAQPLEGSCISNIETVIYVAVVGSTFTNNRAVVQGGGVVAYSLFYTSPSRPNLAVILEISDSRFLQNSARFSSALHVVQSAAVILNMTLVNTTLQENYHQLTDSQHVDEDDAAVLVKGVTRCHFAGEVNFSNNVGSALRIENTLCEVTQFSLATFQQNLALRGGAIYFSGESSSIRLHTGSRVAFIENQAVTEGGALYVAPLSDRLAVLQRGNVECFITSEGDYSLSFLNNRAPLGSIFFGPTQQTCAWAADYLGELNLFNSPPLKITLSNIKGQSVFPGQAMSIDIIVFDAYNETIPALVSSVVDSSNTQATSTLGSSGFWHTSVRESQLTVTTANYTGPLSISIIAEQNSISASFTVNVTPCPLGFSLNELSPKCVCHNGLLNASEILCLEDSVSFVTRENSWIGVDPSISEPTTEDLIIHRCPLNYCKALGNNNTVLPPDFDSQCDLNRSGLLCGGCAEGFSVVFGTNICHKCNNFWLFLIPTLAIAGAALFSGIALLEITTDKGLTNVMIFFGSVVSLFDFLGPPDLDLNHYFLPIRLFALQLGFTTCFYDGMTALERSALLFVFPAYLYVLMGIFTLLCRRFTWMSVQFSPAKTLETLTLMCYLSVLNTTVDILIAIRVDTLAGETSYQWFIDPSVKFFSGGHAPLALLAILTIVLYIIPVPFLFLFPSLVYKYLKRFTPFWDVLFAAYKPKFRFWLGIRVILIITTFPVTRIPLGYAYIITSTLGLVFVVLEALIEPFKDKWANYADVALLSSLNLYIRRLQTLSETPPGNDTGLAVTSDIYLGVIIVIIYVIYILMFALHLHRQFPSLAPKIRQIPTLGPKICSYIMLMKRKKSLPAVETALNSNNGKGIVRASSSALELEVYQPPAIPPFGATRPPPDASKFRDSILDTINDEN